MTTPTKSFCSVCSKAAGVRTGGTGWAVDRFLILELPLPWSRDPLESRSVPPGVLETLMSLWNDEVNVGLFAVAPDEEYSVPGKTRILAFDFAASGGGSSVRLDYLAPVDSVARTIDALARGARLPSSIEVDDTPYRDAMICTHGSRDACCATFGFPLYQTLRKLTSEDPNLRVWRASHIGGHRFAPTMMTFPDGRSWGYLDADTGAAILRRDGPIHHVNDAYRGWSGYADQPLQLLEQEAFLRVGWNWLDYRQSGTVVSRDEVRGLLRAEIVAESPAGVRIELSGDIEPEESVSAMASCGGDARDFARFAVTNVELRELAPAGSLAS
jgi:hypothetical protein